MLNHTAGVGRRAVGVPHRRLRLVITSRRFIELAKLDVLAARWPERSRSSGSRICARSSGLADKLYGLVAPRIAASRHRRFGIAASDPAVILFTSGSEGAPKGVVLSHANLLANRRQLAARVDYSPADHLLNPAADVPQLRADRRVSAAAACPGCRVFLYPSPLHYRIVPELAYGIGATILFGTDTFLAGYARAANPYDFYALRYVFAGAEPVREETRRIWAERFGKRILEGYGVTECSPVIAVNTPMHFKAGTVGRLLPLMRAPAGAGPRHRARTGVLLLRRDRT